MPCITCSGLRKYLLHGSALLLAMTSSSVLATEGALGRSITGVQITPFAGVVPAEPGATWSLNYVHYSGQISGRRQTHLAGQAAFGLDASLDLLSATGVYVWPNSESGWRYASMLSMPYISSDVAASLGLGQRTRRVDQRVSNPYDLYFAPVIAGYRVDDWEYWSIATYIYAPTADYDPKQLANPGLNVWTLSPTLSYTKLFLQGGIELSAQAAVDWYSKNHDTGFENGEVGRLEALAMAHTPGGWGVGVVASWIEQLADDTGPAVRQLDDFRGRSMGWGPAISYSQALADGQRLSLHLRYIDEFNVRNRLDGEALTLSGSVSF